MKLPDIKEFINHWPKSLAILKERVLSYFEKNDIATDNVWFPDIEIVFPESLKNKTNIQVVLFGGFLERFFESGHWPDKKFTFWCLASKVKTVLVETVGFPADSIRVIPREGLFKKTSEQRKLNLNQDIQIVYSGRLSSQKNIEMLLAFCALLQERVSSSVELAMFGEWDNFFPKHRGRYDIKSYQDIVLAFQDRLDFKIRPQVIHHLNHDEWLERIKANALLVNFSTFVCEDFGVSIAQAQALGLPMLLSEWGGHCDVEGENVFYVDVEDIGESLSAHEKILLKAQIVVDKYLAGKLKPAIKGSEATFKESRFLGLDDLSKMRLKAMEKYGHEMWLVGQDRMSLFASSAAGKNYFQEFNSLFSGKSQ